MMGIVMPETCWAYKKYNNKYWHLISFIRQLFFLEHGSVFQQQILLGKEMEVIDWTQMNIGVLILIVSKFLSVIETLFCT